MKQPAGIPPSTVHVWYANYDHAPALADNPSYCTILSAAEIAYAETCAEFRQKEFLVARGSLRILLSQYFGGIEPREWKISTDGFGKPSISGPIETSNLHFNVSHSGGKAAFCFSLVGPVGIDIEWIGRECNLAEIAATCFTPSEQNHLQSKRGEEYAQTFFHYWTLKEAFVKAAGFGLHLPMNKICFASPTEPHFQRFSFNVWQKDRYQIAAAADSDNCKNPAFVEMGNVENWFGQIKVATPLAPPLSTHLANQQIKI